MLASMKEDLEREKSTKLALENEREDFLNEICELVSVIIVIIIIVLLCCIVFFFICLYISFRPEFLLQPSTLKAVDGRRLFLFGGEF